MWFLVPEFGDSTFIAEGVQGVDHELEDAVPHQ